MVCCGSREARNLELEKSLNAREQLLQSLGHLIKDKVDNVINKDRSTEEVSAEIVQLERASEEAQEPITEDPVGETEDLMTGIQDAVAEVEVESRPRTRSRSQQRSSGQSSQRKRTRATTTPARQPAESVLEDEGDDDTPKRRKSVLMKDAAWGWNDRLRDPSPRDPDDQGPSISA